MNGERTAGVFCSVLDNEGIRRIHEASLAILERVGVQVPHEDALSRFADSGAEVDFAAQRVRIPSDLVMCLVRKAAGEFTLYGRDLGRTARFGQGTRNYNSIAGEAWWVDSPGDKRRPP
ncbi:MAG TPA: trimethylamine methyltransferase family protein, partial [Sumerlaeia bacterium]|nr:trimethylamine methyltransferase family protein [Sumerlaeia bacterium]